MIKLKDILIEAKSFGDSITFTEKGIPFKDGLTSELKKEAEDYLKNSLKNAWHGDWKFKKWSTKNDPRIIKTGTRDAYLFGFADCEANSKIMGKKYSIQFDIKWKPNMKKPAVEYTIDLLASNLDEDDIAPKVKKWFMELKPDDSKSFGMPKNLKSFKPSHIPSSFKEPFEDDIVLSYWIGHDITDHGDYGDFRIMDIFEVCYKLYYEEWKKQHPTFFQKVTNKIKKVFTNEETETYKMIKLKDIMNEGSDRATLDKFKNELNKLVPKTLSKSDAELKASRYDSSRGGMQHTGSYNITIMKSFSDGFEFHLNYPSEYHSKEMANKMEKLIYSVAKKYKLQHSKLQIKSGSSNAVYEMDIS